MRYLPTDKREDDPESISKLEGRNRGGKALIVLGGYSAANWAELYASLTPDVLICANGANSLVYDADFWICAENMHRTAGLAQKGDVNSIALMEMFHHDSNAKTKLVSHWSWDLLTDTTDCLKIRRQGYDIDELPADFTFRKYGQGYLAGWLLKHKDAGAGVHVGTIGLQAIHHAGMLGCDEIHTIGYDLCFKDHERHHAYKYPTYKIDKFRKPAMFITYKGLPTQWVWVESAQYLKELKPYFKRDGIRWTDHSDGLLQVEGVA